MAQPKYKELHLAEQTVVTARPSAKRNLADEYGESISLLHGPVQREMM